MLQCIIHSVHRGPIPFLRYPIHRFAFWQRGEMISAEVPPFSPSPPDCTEVTRCDTRCKDVNSAGSQRISEQATVCFFFLPPSSSSPNHYFIIWLMLPRCCQNAYTFPQRWKTNRGNLFLQIRYWSQWVCWASDIFPEKWMSNGKHHYFFIFFFFAIKEASVIAMCFERS